MYCLSTCYARKLEKHLSICNARQTELPAYVVHNINSPLGDGGGESGIRPLLSEVPREELLRVIDKVNHLYESEYVYLLIFCIVYVIIINEIDTGKLNCLFQST